METEIDQFVQVTDDLVPMLPQRGSWTQGHSLGRSSQRD